MGHWLKRLKLQEELEDIVGKGHVYFQPPSSIRMLYPAMVYNLSALEHRKANNSDYINYDEYECVYITPHHMPEVLEQLDAMQYSHFVRHFEEDNLHHYVYTIYATKE